MTTKNHTCINAENSRLDSWNLRVDLSIKHSYIEVALSAKGRTSTRKGTPILVGYSGTGGGGASVAGTYFVTFT